MADDNIIIEGTVKFRDGKKWKSRWCVMRKLSPVADCVQLQVWRDARARCGGGGGGGGGAGGCKAALSLQQYLGHEAGFTLDKHSNTLALLCSDLTALLAFDTRERLMQWQVKVQMHLGVSREYLVQVWRCAGGGGGGGGGGRGRVPAGPARLHVAQRRAALVAGSPPKLLAVWELQHLRRYGVVEGRFCLEGGSRCGAGEGLHVLLTDQARDIARAFDLAAIGQLDHRIHNKSLAESPRSQKSYRPDTRLSELQQGARAGAEVAGQEAGGRGEREEMWPSSEELGDTTSVCEPVGAGGAGGVALSRCRSCMSKLGQLSRSSTAALTPGARHFSPNWTMEALEDTCSSLPRSVSSEYRCPPAPAPTPAPPRPPRLDQRKPAAPLPGHTHRTTRPEDTRVGPYENYDVPRLPSSEIDGEYYDTPKRLKECLNEDLFRMTKNSTPSTLILKKPCGCLLKFGRRRREVGARVVETEESGAGEEGACPCRRVTAWASSWLQPSPSLPATPSTPGTAPADKENLRPSGSEHSALYAMVDVTRKTRRRTPQRPELELEPLPSAVEIDEGPLANYENLNFALSLEHYENAREVLRRAGLTPRELDALAVSLRSPAAPLTRPRDHYLLMQPNSQEPACSGYTPMSPVSGFDFHTLGRTPRPARPSSLLDEKSASNPALCDAMCAGSGALVGSEAGVAVECRVQADVHLSGSARVRGRETARGEARVRCSSADSSRFLEDVEECGGSACSIDTLLPPGELRECAGEGGAAAAAGGEAGSAPCRDSSSSNDSGVSVCSLRRAPPPSPAPTPATAPPRRAHSTDLLHGPSPRVLVPAKSSSAEAEVPLLTGKPLRMSSVSGGGACGGAVVDSRSTSSDTSDMSDYIETLSLCSSHSSTTDAHATTTTTVHQPVTMRVVRHTTSTLRPRSGKEYLSLGPAGVAAGAGVAGACCRHGDAHT